jgi:hypothetical protein
MQEATISPGYAFLTTEPNAEVGAVHPKAMPVILTTADEVEIWMMASPDEALKAAASASGWGAQDRSSRRQGRSGRADSVTDEDDYSQAGPLGANGRHPRRHGSLLRIGGAAGQCGCRFGFDLSHSRLFELKREYLD